MGAEDGNIYIYDTRYANSLIYLLSNLTSIIVVYINTIKTTFDLYFLFLPSLTKALVQM